MGLAALTYIYREDIDAIKSMSVAIAESLGHMYGLQVYYYRDMRDFRYLHR